MHNKLGLKELGKDMIQFIVGIAMMAGAFYTPIAITSFGNKIYEERAKKIVKQEEYTDRYSMFQDDLNLRIKEIVGVNPYDYKVRISRKATIIFNAPGNYFVSGWTSRYRAPDAQTLNDINFNIIDTPDSININLGNIPLSGIECIRMVKGGFKLERAVVKPKNHSDQYGGFMIQGDPK